MTLLEEFHEALQADEDESLTCKVCNAHGFEPCDLRVHVSTLAGFSAVNARRHRIYSFQRARGMS